LDSHIGDSVAFHGFRIVNGYIKDRITWESNSIVKKLRVFHNRQAVMDIGLTDCMALQEAESIDIFYIKPDDKIIVKILEVYPGNKYKDTALTELIPLGAH
jgi:hypothetical protein